MLKRRTDALICALAALMVAGAVLSSLERPDWSVEQAKSLMFPASVTAVTIAAGALGDVRYMDVPP
jgi:hypothetical protein